jgi:hypothetical protein
VILQPRPKTGQGRYRDLQVQKQAQQFKSVELPDSIAYLGPKLKKGKAFEDAELRANAAGTCAESSLAFSNKINSACNALLLALLNASEEELDELKAWRDGIRQDVAAWNSHIKIASDVGAKLAAGILNKETGGHSLAVGEVRRAFAHQQHLAQQFPLTDTPLFG